MRTFFLVIIIGFCYFYFHFYYISVGPRGKTRCFYYNFIYIFFFRENKRIGCFLSFTGAMRKVPTFGDVGIFILLGHKINAYETQLKSNMKLRKEWENKKKKQKKCFDRKTRRLEYNRTSAVFVLCWLIGKNNIFRRLLADVHDAPNA